MISVFFQARDAATQKIIQDNGPHAYLIPSSDHPHIIAGQGSIALEFLEQVCNKFFLKSRGAEGGEGRLWGWYALHSYYYMSVCILFQMQMLLMQRDLFCLSFTAFIYIYIYICKLLKYILSQFMLPVIVLFNICFEIIYIYQILCRFLDI